VRINVDDLLEKQWQPSTTPHDVVDLMGAQRRSGSCLQDELT
jgi:hypothetical protein